MQTFPPQGHPYTTHNEPNQSQPKPSQPTLKTLPRNLGFAWGVRSGPKGTVIDLPIFGFEENNPYPVRANTMKQIGFHILGFALGVCSGPKAIDLPIFGEGLGALKS